MARDIVIDATVREDSAALRRLADELDRTAGKTDTFSDDLDEASKSSGELDRQMAALRVRVRELGEEFDRTGDRAILPDLSKNQAMLRRLERLSKQLRDVGDEAGKGFLTNFVGMLPSRLRGALILGLVGVGVAVSPAIGAAVAGAVAGTVGLGGIAGGIAMASKSPRVRSAAHQFGQDIAAEFFAGGGAFVQPTVDALGILQKGFRDLDLGDSFAKVAPHVTRLAQGIADMGREFMPGFNRAMEAAGPALDMFARELPEVGEALGTMLGDIAESEGTIAGMQALMDGLAGTLRVTGVVVSWLSDRFRDFVDAGALLSTFAEENVPLLTFHFRNSRKHFEDWQHTMDGVKLHTEGNIEGFRRLAPAIDYATGMTVEQTEAAENLANAMSDANAAIDQFFGTEMDVAKAADGVEAAIDDFTAAMKANGRTLDANTEKGRKNRDTVRDMIVAAQRHRSALAANASTSASAQIVYDKEIARIEKLAKKYGITRQELEKIAGDYTINVTTTYRTRGSPPVFIKSGAFAGDFKVEYGRITARQHGGPLLPGGAYIVNEGRPEVIQMGPGASGYVHPSVGAYRASQRNDPIRVELIFSGADGEFVRMLRRIVRIEGAGNVQAALGRT